MPTIARGLIAVAVVMTALLVSGRVEHPADANHPLVFPVNAGITVESYTPDPADPSDWTMFGCIPSYYETIPDGWDTLFLRVAADGSIDGACHYSDSSSGCCDTSSGSVTGTINFTNNTVELFYDGSATVNEDIDDHYTVLWNGNGTYDPQTHDATGSGVYSWTCDAEDCPGAASGQGTLQWTFGLEVIDSADFSIAHIEVVQVVQDAENTVPLVARASTLARVYVKSDLALSSVAVTLKARRGGNELSGPPQLLNAGIVSTGEPVRDRIDGSFNFLLPDGWTTEGGVILEAEVTPPAGISDPAEENNKRAAAFGFQVRKSLNVRYLPVCVQPGGTGTPACPSQFVSSYASFMQKIFPIANGLVLYRPLAVPQWNWPKAITNLAGSYEVNAALRKRFDLIEASEGSRPDQLAGWMPRNMQNPLLGLSDPLWYTGPLGTGFGRVSLQQDTRDLDPLDPTHTLAHEIAHNLGRRHPNRADSCGARDNNTDWPHATSTIQEIGFDIDERELKPSTKFDVMTYCSPPFSNIWISPFTYKKLFEGNFAPASVGTTGAQSQYLIISGSASADGSGGTLDPAYVVTSTIPSEAAAGSSGTHCLRFGPVIVDYCFTLEFEEHRTHEMLDENFFSLKVPFPEGSTSVSLTSGATELAHLDASASPPSVDVTTPSGFSSGNKTLSWSGSDADGGQLFYTVLYSPDGGDSWLPIEVDTLVPQFTFDVGSLDPSNQGMFRVLASDGLNTAIDTTPPVPVGMGAAGVKGDVDCSGGRTSVDALIVLQLASNLLDSAPCEEAGNVNCDADLNSLDALFILQDISGFDVALPPGCPPFE